MSFDFTVAQYLDRIRTSIHPTGTETVAIVKSAGRVLAEDATARLDLPPWDNSAMDGYAVRSADVEAASEDQPITLAVVGEIAAGSTQTFQLSPGQALAIMTGAPVPEGADTVIPIEDVDGFDPDAPTAGVALPPSITMSTPPRTGQHIRRRGEDITTGAPILSAGTTLSAHHVGALAAAGIGEVTVHRRPRVAVIATGDELVEPGTPVKFGQIPDSNSVLVATAVERAGASLHSIHRASDDPDAFAKLLDSVAEADVLVVTGGASVGAHDVSKHVLTDRGIEFVTVKMQPGKPQGFGVQPEGPVTWVLPGNPVSVLVSLQLFVIPGIGLMSGVSRWEPAFRAVTVSTGWRPRKARDQYIPVRITSEPGMPETVGPASERGSGSHLAARMAWADGIAHIPAQDHDVVEGEQVRFLPFN